MAHRVPSVPDARECWEVSRTVVQVPYSEFEHALEKGRVAEVIIGDTIIRGKLKEPDANGKTLIAATRVETDLAARLCGYHITFTRVVDGTFVGQLILWILPTVVFFGVWYFLFRRFAENQGMGNFMMIGMSRAKVYVQKDTGVAGVDEA